MIKEWRANVSVHNSLLVQNEEVHLFFVFFRQNQ